MMSRGVYGIGLVAATLFGAAPAVAQIPGVDDVVNACGGFRMVVVIDAQLPIDEIEAIVETLRARLGARGGFMSEALDAVRADEDGRIEVLRAGGIGLGFPVEAFLANGQPLSVHAVVTRQSSPEASGPGLIVALDADFGPDYDDEYVVMQAEPLIAHLGIAQADFTLDYNNQPTVDLRLTERSATAFGMMSAENIGNPIALMLGNRLLTAPVIQEAIWGGSVQIAANFTVENAEELAAELRAASIVHTLLVEETSVIEAAGGLDAVCAAIDTK